MDPIFLLPPPRGAEISFTTEEQKAFFADENRFIPHEQDLRVREKDLTIPLSVTFRWSGEKMEEGILHIAEAEDFSTYASFPGKDRSARVRNLKRGQKYFCRVEACGRFSDVYSFSVAEELPRWIHVPGVTNVRDLGGWKNKEGRKIRQGMIFRGAQLEALSSPSPSAEEGKKVLLEELQIHTELDLRGVEEGRKILSFEQYIKRPLSAYATWGGKGIFTEEHMGYIREIFSLFSRKENYPIYFHCAGGGDRTGTIAFLLEALLGLEEETLITEYELSNLSISGERTHFTEVWVKFMEKLDSFAPGRSRQEQVKNFLLACGVTEEELTAIPELLLAPPAENTPQKEYQIS